MTLSSLDKQRKARMQDPSDIINLQNSQVGQMMNWFYDNCLASVLLNDASGDLNQSKINKEFEKDKRHEIREYSKDLDIARGLPLTNKHLAAELDLSLKQVHCLLCLCGPRRELDSLVKEIHDVVKPTLTRVHLLLYGEVAKQHQMVRTIQKIAEKSEALIEGSSQAALLVCVWVACLLMQGRCIESLEILDCASQILSRDTPRPTDNCNKVDGEKGHSVLDQAQQNDVSVAAVVHYLHVCALCQTLEWSRALDIIDRHTGCLAGNIQGQIQYLKAYCLYHHGDFSAAMKICQMLQEEMTEDQTARPLLNLIGCCLKQMGKPHLAVQQFRRALESPCTVIHTPSLYNVCIVYRDLGEVDAELESLELLVKALDDHSIASSHDLEDLCALSWPEVSLVPQALSRGSPKSSSCAGQGVGYVLALYTLARRNLDVKRTENAAERFLDLLAVLGDESPAKDGYCHGDTTLLPPLQTVYLDAATALLRADRLDEALAICDQLLSKSKLVQHPDVRPHHHGNRDDIDDDDDEEDMEDGEFPFLDRSLQVPTVQGAGPLGEMPTDSDSLDWVTSQRGRQDPTREAAGSGGTSSRKRQREPSGGAAPIPPQLGDGSNTRNGGGTHTEERRVKEEKDDDDEEEKEEEELLYTAHALLLQAQCLHRQGASRDSLEVAGQSLSLLQRATSLGSEDRSDRMGPISSGDEKKPKRRKIESGLGEHLPPGDTCSTGLSPTQKNSRVATLKSEAYLLQAGVLMAQNKLPDAMSNVLLSLQCFPSNLDALKSHAVLLEKLGRKSEAVRAWSRLKDAKAATFTSGGSWKCFGALSACPTF